MVPLYHDVADYVPLDFGVWFYTVPASQPPST